MVIYIRDIVTGADTADDGGAVYSVLKQAIDKDSAHIWVSFRDVKTATSSFTNSSFLRIAQDIGLDALKQRIRVVDASSQIRMILKDRVVGAKVLQPA